jgi:exopolyphosphatase/guanosine-5'-triphosphate,3'-diphosphate pyrophosphatase
LEEDLTPERQKIGINQILEFKNKIHEFNPSITVAGTSSYISQIPKGISFIGAIQKATQINPLIIDPNSLAMLALISVTQELGDTEENFVVWDIGGAQMRMISKDKKDGYFTSLGEWGSIIFKNRIIDEIQKKKKKKNRSPNPIDPETSGKALEISRNWGGQVDPRISNKIKLKNVKVIGIGGVHYSSVRQQANPSSSKFTSLEVEAAIKRNLNKPDNKLIGNFPETQVTNLILVLGFMKELKIDMVETSQADLIDGLLINPSLKF